MSASNTIIIENNNGVMWYIDEKIVDITNVIVNDNDLCISLNGEGPCAESLGLYKLLDMVCDRTGYNPTRIQIHTNNLKESHSVYKIHKHAPYNWVKDLQKEATENPHNFKNVNNDTKHFGNFVGHSSRIRLHIAGYLRANYKEQCMQTFHTTPDNEIHREFVGLEDMWFHGASITDIRNSINLLDESPLTFDDIKTYPILDEKMYRVIDCYDRFFVDIAYSTFFSGNSFYTDEKIWRPIISKTPFIVHGPQNFLHNLKQLGFQTFDRWWDEGYSEDPPDYQVSLIKENIDFIATKSTSELVNIYEEMKPVLEHNYDTFMSLTESDFLGKTFL